jgi:hypothetical protein
VTVRGGLAIDWAAQVKVTDDRAGAQVKEFADECSDFFI